MCCLSQSLQPSLQYGAQMAHRRLETWIAQPPVSGGEGQAHKHPSHKRGRSIVAKRRGEKNKVGSEQEAVGGAAAPTAAQTIEARLGQEPVEAARRSWGVAMRDAPLLTQNGYM